MITVTNRRSIQLEVLKASSEDDTPLSDAEFALYRAEDFNDTLGEPLYGANPVLTGVSGNMGILDFGTVSVGSYRLVETRSPHGYFRLLDPIYITVRRNGISFTQDGMTYEATRVNLSKYRVTVYNDPYHYISDTGVFDVLKPVPIAVCLVIITAVWAAYFRRRRRMELS